MSPPADAPPFLRVRASLVVRAFAQRYARPLKFLSVGVLNAVFGYLVFASIYLLIQSDMAAVVMATVIGVVFNYFSTGRLVFAHSGLRRLPLFLLGYGLICAVNLGALKLLGQVGIGSLLGQCLLILPLAVLSYVVNANLVFRARYLAKLALPDVHARESPAPQDLSLPSLACHIVAWGP